MILISVLPLTSDPAGPDGVAQPTKKTGLEGLEPPTAGFGIRCSSQLSYRPSYGSVLFYSPDAAVSTSKNSLYKNAPDTTRTCDLRFRKPPLYPPELRGRACRYQYFIDTPQAPQFTSNSKKGAVSPPHGSFASAPEGLRPPVLRSGPQWKPVSPRFR